MNIHAEQREKQLGSQIGSDLTHFNIYRKAITTKTYTIGEESYYNPPKRKINNIKLFESRLRKSRQLNDLMKIGSFKKNNTTNHPFPIICSVNGRCPYDVISIKC